MKKQIGILLSCILFGLLISGQKNHARPIHAKPLRPGLPVYRLTPLPIEDAHPSDYVWLIEETTYGGSFAYRSLTAPALLIWLDHLPKGAEIQYWSTPYPIGGYRGGEEILVFAHHCRQRGVHFSSEPVL